MCELGKQIKVEVIKPGLTIPDEWSTEAPTEPVTVPERILQPA